MRHPVFTEYQFSTMGRVMGPRRLLKLGWAHGYRTWTGYLNRKAHTKVVHRTILELFVGPCPEGMVARHLNGVSHDNRVTNLAWGTKAENEADKIVHGTVRRGSAHGQARLTESQVLAIRRDPRLLRVIAEEYGVSMSAIHHITSGRRWEHVEGTEKAPDRSLKGRSLPPETKAKLSIAQRARFARERAEKSGASA